MISPDFLLGLGVGVVIAIVVGARYAHRLLEYRLNALLAVTTWKFLADNGREFDITMELEEE